jgi:hypothetical protein
MLGPINRIAVLPVFAGAPDGFLNNTIAIGYQLVFGSIKGLAGLNDTRLGVCFAFPPAAFVAGPARLRPSFDYRQPFAVALAKLGGVCGNSQSEQQARGNQGFHGGYLSWLTG